MKGNISVTVMIWIIIGLVILGVIIYATNKAISPVNDITCNEENDYCVGVQTQSNIITNLKKTEMEEYL